MAQSKQKPCYRGKPWSLCHVTTLLPEHYQHLHSSSLQRLLKQERRHHIWTLEDKKFIQPWIFLISLSKPREISGQERWLSISPQTNHLLYITYISVFSILLIHTPMLILRWRNKSSPCRLSKCALYDIWCTTGLQRKLVHRRSGGATCHLSSDTKSFQSASL